LQEKAIGATELGRVLVKFSLSNLSQSIFVNKTIPSSSVQYLLKMYDMPHDDTTPTSYDLYAFPLSQSWDEGIGVDIENLSLGYANWAQPNSITNWTNAGGDFISSSFSASQHFDQGTDDLEMDITPFVNEWLSGTTIANNGLILMLSSTYENNTIDYYIKDFYGRSTKFIDKLPFIEARWNDARKDNRKNFAYNQNNNLYLYNFVRGQLQNLSQPILVRVQDHISSSYGMSGAIGGSASFMATYTASFVETGIYSMSLNVVNTASFSGTFYDIWFSGASSYLTGAFSPLNLTGSQVDPYNEFVLSVTNLKETYGESEQDRLKVFVRKKDYRTHVGVLKSASFAIQKEYIENLYWSVSDHESGAVIIPYGTGSYSHTQCSYNADGNYFDLDFSMFVPGFTYELQFLLYNNKYDKKVFGTNGEYIFKII
jgi:hypothetical protein